jgi:hypothetical protein
VNSVVGYPTIVESVGTVRSSVQIPVETCYGRDVTAKGRFAIGCPFIKKVNLSKGPMMMLDLEESYGGIIFNS